MAKACNSKKMKDDSSKSKKIIESLKKEITSLKTVHQKDLEAIAKDAYTIGYGDAMVDFDKKAEEMEKHLNKALNQFEKEYEKKTKSPAKKSKKVKK